MMGYGWILVWLTICAAAFLASKLDVLAHTAGAAGLALIAWAFLLGIGSGRWFFDRAHTWEWWPFLLFGTVLLAAGVALRWLRLYRLQVAGR